MFGKYKVSIYKLSSSHFSEYNCIYHVSMRYSNAVAADWRKYFTIQSAYSNMNLRFTIHCFNIQLFSMLIYRTNHCKIYYIIYINTLEVIQINKNIWTLLLNSLKQYYPSNSNFPNRMNSHEWQIKVSTCNYIRN